jgi:hypothetical protein
MRSSSYPHHTVPEHSLSEQLFFPYTHDMQRVRKGGLASPCTGSCSCWHSHLIKGGVGLPNIMSCSSWHNHLLKKSNCWQNYLKQKFVIAGTTTF